MLGVRFDDRLKTAIMQPVVDQHDRIVRWRQVVDILSRLPETYDEAIVDAGFALVEREAPAIPEDARAATARNIAGRPTNFRIISLFARDRLAVAAPVLATANLSASEWTIISRDCSTEVAGFIQTLIRNVPTPREIAQLDEDGESIAGAFETIGDSETPSISQMVARIEKLRTRRAADESETQVELSSGDRALPQTDEWPVKRPLRSDRPAHTESLGKGVFRWECDPGGQIAWVDGAPRGALVGSNLTAIASDRHLSRALEAREPFDGIEAHFETPVMGGDWRLSGLPAFNSRDGRFLGYRGVARRDSATDALEKTTSSSSAPSLLGKPRDLDALRETIHEIKTPLNAIIGFAEIIDGQYLGPAHRNYRLRAAGIVAQARTLLEAIRDMEFAARGGSAAAGKGAILDGILDELSEDLSRRAERLGVVLTFQTSEPGLTCGIEPELASRLIHRFAAAIVDAAESGERIALEASREGEQCLIAISRPRSTRGADEEFLMEPSFSVGSDDQSVLGLGFALRLARGLVRLVGGDVVIGDNNFTLRLPGA